MGHFILCKMCGEKKFGNPAAGYIYCSRKCREADPDYRKKLWQRSRYHKIAEIPCKQCSKTFEIRASVKGKRKFCSVACSSKFRSGENHHQWTGGSLHYYGKNWTWQRKNARKRDGNVCQVCGKTKAQNKGKNMDVHHIIPFKSFSSYKEANRTKNLISLCINCHRKQNRKAIALSNGSSTTF